MYLAVLLNKYQFATVKKMNQNKLDSNKLKVPELTTNL